MYCREYSYPRSITAPSTVIIHGCHHRICDEIPEGAFWMRAQTALCRQVLGVLGKRLILTLQYIQFRLDEFQCRFTCWNIQLFSLQWIKPCATAFLTLQLPPNRPRFYTQTGSLSWCHLLFYFTYYALNMFRTLIYPSSGACDCVDELPHPSSCSVKTDVLALV